ncbi:hypothetical protein B0O99DRAFT_736197 [Bisporella sp. PMI_857]|nr:hypothetical protein B0O99DRAFT_736197 [Bisporella sp. PMI_857]
MQRNTLSKILRQGVQFRTQALQTRRASIALSVTKQHSRLPQRKSSAQQSLRYLSVTTPRAKGITPESEDPQPKVPEEVQDGAIPADLTIERYNELSDVYMDSIVEKLEALQEEREDVDVEYSAGVLTLTFPPIGTYVINKQPPNKQIWLSSPISGPKRYDYVISSEGQNAKEGTGSGNWVYLRDNSTLQELLLAEIGIDIESFEPSPPSIDE